MSPMCNEYAYDLASFPRVSGDEPRFISSRDRGTSFSPRERG